MRDIIDLSRKGVVVSKHAINACCTDKKIRGEIVINNELISKITVSNVFEIEYCGQFVQKIAVRVPYDEQNDVSIVLLKDPYLGIIVKTVWGNRKGDNHVTLDKSRYTKP